MPPASMSRASISPMRISTSPGSTACFTLPGSPGCAASATSSRSTSAATCSRAGGFSRRPRVQACGSSSPRRRRSTEMRSGIRRRRRPSRGRSRPYGITKLGCEQLAHAYAQGFGLDAVVLRYFTFYGPRQRPDMALARIVDALARGSSFELLRRRAPVPFVHVRRRWSRGDDRGDGARPGGRRLQRRRRRGGDDARGDRDVGTSVGPHPRPRREARRPPVT